MPEDEEKAVAGPPCGACRTLRRRCVPGCVFAPYFTAEDFAAVHAVFGASNAAKMLARVELPEQRAVAAATLVEEARARAADPTFGRVAYLRILQEVNDKARKQVDDKRAKIAREFGALAAALPVDVAAAAPEVRAEARAQVDAALKHARELDARLIGVRRDNESRWRELHPEEDMGTGNLAGHGKGIDNAKRRREPAMLMPPPPPAKQRRPPGFPDELSHQQMAAAEAEREQVAAPAEPHGHHHLAAQHGETEPPRVPEVCGNGHPHQQMSEAMMRSVQVPAAAPLQHLDSAGQQQPCRAGDAAAGRAQGQGGTSVLLEAMMQLASAGDEQQQPQHHPVAQHADKEYDIARDMMQLQELLDMAELARKQQMMKDGVMAEMGQWDAAAGRAMGHDAMTMTQQIPANTWQHNHPGARYGGMRDGPQDQEMPRQMEEPSTAALAKTTTGNMSQQFAWAHQQYHDYPAAAAHCSSPWQHQMAGAHHQPAAASASQAVASEQDMLLLLQQHQAGGGARQFGNLAAQYDDTELTLGYGHHPDMHQQVVAAGQFARAQDMNSRHAAAAAHAEQQHAQTGLDDMALGNGHPPDTDTQAMLQELAALFELGAGKQDMVREQDVVTTTTTQQDPADDDAWLLEKLEQMEKEAMERKRERLMRQFVAAERAREQELIAQQAAAAQQLQHHPVVQDSEKKRKMETLMRRFVAAERAREQELIAQQQHPVEQQYSGTELGVSLGHDHGHPYWHQPTVQQMLQEQQMPTVQEMLQEQQLADAVGFADQQPQPNGHQMGSSLPPLRPPSSSQLRNAQVSHQQRTDGGGHGLNSDLAAYLNYESLSRHGVPGNSRFHQG